LKHQGFIYQAKIITYTIACTLTGDVRHVRQYLQRIRHAQAMAITQTNRTNGKQKKPYPDNLRRITIQHFVNIVFPSKKHSPYQRTTAHYLAQKAQLPL
jgi:hypothetical protein